MAENILEIVLKAKDEASKTIEGLGKSVEDTKKKTEDMGKAFGIAGGIITGIGVGGAVMMKGWVEAAAGADAEMVKVNTILQGVQKEMATTTKVIGGNSSELNANAKAVDAQIKSKQQQIQILKLSGGEHKNEIAEIQKSINALKLQSIQIDQTTVVKGKLITVVNKNAKSLEELTTATDKAAKAMVGLGFDDEEASVVFAKNLSLTKDITKAREMLTTAADLARYKDIGLAEAGQALQMVYMGNTKILKQLGVEVDDNATKEQILASVYQKVKGQAQNYSETFVGGMAIMKVQTDNLKEALGERLLPAVTKIVQKVSDFVEKINNLDPKIIDTVVQITALVTGISLVLGPLLLLIAALPALAAGFTLLTGPLGIVLAVAVGIGAAALYIATHWQQLQPKLQPVIDFLVGVFNTISQGFLKFINDNIPTFMAIWQTMVGVLEVGLGFISALWNAVWPAIQELFSGVWTAISGIFQTIWGVMQVVLGIGLGVFTGKWSDAWNLMKTGFHNIFDGIANYFKGWWETIKGFFRTGLDGIIGMLNGFINTINKVGGNLGLKISIPNIPSFDNGGWVKDTGLAMVHKGEFVLSNAMIAGKQSAPVSTTNNNMPINITAVVQSIADIDLLGQRLAFQFATSGRL